MSVSPDSSQVQTRGKVLGFPVTSLTARKNWSGLRKYRLIAALIAVGIIGAIGAVLWDVGAKSTVHYVTTPVTRGPVKLTITATGTVNPQLTIIVGTYVSGVIESIFCDYNTEVRAGQVCSKIDPRPFEAILNQYAGQLLRDQAILGKDQKDLARYQQLATENSIAHQQAEDQAYVVQQDQATVKLDQALVEGAQLNLEYTNIVSPVDGTVVSRNATQGETVAASFQTPTLFLIATDLKTDGSRCQCQRERYRRHQARRRRRLHCRRVSQANLPSQSEPSPPVAAKRPKRHHLRCGARRR